MGLVEATEIEKLAREFIEARYDWPDDKTKLVWPDFNFGHLISEIHSAHNTGYKAGLAKAEVLVSALEKIGGCQLESYAAMYEMIAQEALKEWRKHGG